MRAVSDGIFRPGGLALTDRMAELAGLAPGWTVLDVGCGTGASVMRLRQRFGACAVGMDALFSQVRPQEDRNATAAPLPLVIGTAEHPPFRRGAFRMILCECVLSLLPDTRAALATLHALLAPGGILGITDLYLRTGPGSPNGAASPSSLPHGSCLGWRADRRAIAEHLHHTGFTLRRFEDHSKQLGELAARLVLAGESPCLLSPAGACGDSTGPDTGTPGYFLLLADRRTA